jgi:unsaturated rhamnogalacturonyl hydrolase
MSQVSSQVIPTTNSWAVRMADSALARYSLPRAHWHYEHGLVVKAIADMGAATGEKRYEQFVQAWVDHFVTPEGHIRTYRLEEFNLDQISPGRLLFPLYARDRDDRYAHALQLLYTQLQNQPRTHSGGFWHKQIYPYQMWLDGIYMAGPFYAEYARAFGKPEGFDDVARQVILIERQTRDPHSGLLYHAWDESRKQRWANPETGCSPHFWGRADGWFIMALVEILDLLPGEHPLRAELLSILARLARSLVDVQDASTGLWYQVLDQPQRPGNYGESSVTAMLVYSFARAVRKGYLTCEYLLAARRGYRGLLENQIKVGARGLLNLEGTCSVAGLGGRPYRDGSYEYYTREKIATNDYKGVGPFILAALEMDHDGAVAPEAE